jgi:hypothetical protein
VVVQKAVRVAGSVHLKAGDDSGIIDACGDCDSRIERGRQSDGHKYSPGDGTEKALGIAVRVRVDTSGDPIVVDTNSWVNKVPVAGTFGSLTEVNEFF